MLNSGWHDVRKVVVLVVAFLEMMERRGQMD